jgi:phytoene dehydrogenase-like protein
MSALERSPLRDPSLQGVSPSDASELKEAVLELYRVREYFDETVAEFASGIAVALQESFEFPVVEVPAFEDRLAKLLAITPLGITSKARILKSEYERKFCTARILTDARPVYTESPSSPPSAVMIMHSLRVTFHDDTGAMRETYIAMDDDDLETMRELVDRAEEKSKSLRSVFENAKIKVVAP